MSSTSGKKHGGSKKEDREEDTTGKGGMNPPNYKYFGPGNSLDRGDPYNDVDAVAREHDKGYDNELQQGGNPYIHYNVHDVVMSNKLKGTKDANLMSNFGRALLHGKKMIFPHEQGTDKMADDAVNHMNDVEKTPLKRPAPGAEAADPSRAKLPKMTEAGEESNTGGGPVGVVALPIHYGDTTWHSGGFRTKSTREFLYQNKWNEKALPYQIHKGTLQGGADRYIIESDWHMVDWNRVQGHMTAGDWQRLVRTARRWRPKSYKVVYHSFSCIQKTKINDVNTYAIMPLGTCLHAKRPHGSLPYAMNGLKQSASGGRWGWSDVPTPGVVMFQYMYHSSFTTKSYIPAPTFMVEHGKVNQISSVDSIVDEGEFDATWVWNRNKTNQHALSTGWDFLAYSDADATSLLGAAMTGPAKQIVAPQNTSDISQVSTGGQSLTTPHNQMYGKIALHAQNDGNLNLQVKDTHTTLNVEGTETTHSDSMWVPGRLHDDRVFLTEKYMKGAIFEVAPSEGNKSFATHGNHLVKRAPAMHLFRCNPMKMPDGSFLNTHCQLKCTVEIDWEVDYSVHNKGWQGWQPINLANGGWQYGQTEPTFIPQPLPNLAIDENRGPMHIML